MTPRTHIRVIEHNDGTISFQCFYCGAVVGPIAKALSAQVEMQHKPECVYIEANHLNRMAASSRMQ